MISIKSKIAELILSFFFLHEDESFYINEIVRCLGVDKRNLVKKLKEFEKEGLFVSQLRGNQRYYQLNKKYPLYKEYKKIVMKTIGFEKQLRQILIDMEGIKDAYIFGSYAKDKMDVSSDIDILVIGNHDTILLHKKISSLQKKIDREINVISISKKEFEIKKKKKDPFIFDILQKKKIKII